MELSFPFKSGITATVNVISKTIDAHTYWQGEYNNIFHKSYTTNEEMIELLGRASKCVNIDNHWDVIELINRLYISKGGDLNVVKYDEHYVRDYPFYAIVYWITDFINELRELLEDYNVYIKHSSDEYTERYDVFNDDVLIATIYHD